MDGKVKIIVQFKVEEYRQEEITLTGEEGERVKRYIEDKCSDHDFDKDQESFYKLYHDTEKKLSGKYFLVSHQQLDFIVSED